MSDEPAFHSNRFETAPKNILRHLKMLMRYCDRSIQRSRWRSTRGAGQRQHLQFSNGHLCNRRRHATCGLGLFLAGMSQSFQIGRDGGIGVLKRVFLAPLNDGGRADPLHDPMINSAVWASVQQDVGDVVANRESRIGWLGSQLRRDQEKPSFENPILTKWGRNCCWLKIH